MTEDSEIASCAQFGANRFLTLPLSVQFFTNGGVTPSTQFLGTSRYMCSDSTWSIGRLRAEANFGPTIDIVRKKRLLLRRKFTQSGRDGFLSIRFSCITQRGSPRSKRYWQRENLTECPRRRESFRPLEIRWKRDCKKRAKNPTKLLIYRKSR